VLPRILALCAKARPEAQIYVKKSYIPGNSLKDSDLLVAGNFAATFR
jgi:hypothetical protein